MSMNIPELKFETEWIRRIDESFVLDLSNRALWAVFEGSIDKIPPEVTDCLDISCENSVPYWTAYNDATDEELKAAKYFRYIVMAH